MIQERTWQQVVALADGVLCLIMAAFCAVSGIAMVALRDSEDLASQTLRQLPDTPAMREIETSGVHAFLFGIGIFLIVFGVLKAAHGFFAMRASRPGRPRSIGYVIFAGLFVMASLFLVVAHAISVAGGQPLEVSLLVTGILSLALSVVVLVASLGVRSQETSMTSSTAEPGQTAKPVTSSPVSEASDLPQLGKSDSPQPLGKRETRRPIGQAGRSGRIPRQNPSRTGGIPKQAPSQTGGIPRQNPSRTGGIPRQRPSQTGGMPKQPPQAGGMPQPGKNPPKRDNRK